MELGRSVYNMSQDGDVAYNTLKGRVLLKLWRLAIVLGGSFRESITSEVLAPSPQASCGILCIHSYDGIGKT